MGIMEILKVVKSKWRIIGLNILFLGLLTCPSMIRLLATTNSGGGTGILVNPLKDTTLAGLINTILSAIIQVGIVVVTFFIVYAGFKYVTAQGNTTNLSKAHEGIKWTVFGSAIVLGAFVIQQIVTDTVGGLLKSSN